MKKIVIFILSSLIISACKKDLNACKNYKEISGQAKLLEGSSGYTTPGLSDTLAKYPQLQLYHFNKNDYGWVAICHVFYKGLPVFSDDYTLIQGPGPGNTSSMDTLLTGPLGISLQPKTSYKDAISLAKHLVNFDHTCISYQLGLFNILPSSPLKNRDYHLAWKIQGENGSPYVIMDANNVTVLLMQSTGNAWLE